MTNTALRSFAAGEVAPKIYARTDLLRYVTGLRTCRNFIVQPQGGVENRWGTRCVVPTKFPNKRARLLPFVFDDTQAYVLEFGDRYIRFIYGGGQLLATADLWNGIMSVPYAVDDLVEWDDAIYRCIVAHTSGDLTEPGVGADWTTVWLAFTNRIYEVISPYTEADLPDLQIVQDRDVVILVHPRYPVHTLKRYAHTHWIIAPAVFGPSIQPPSSLAVSGGVAGAVRYWAVTAVLEATLEESLAALISDTDVVPDAGTPTVLTWGFVTGASEYRVYRSDDGFTFGLVGITSGLNLEDASDTSWGTASDMLSSAVKDEWVTSSGQARNQVLTVASDKASNGKYRLEGTIQITGTDTSEPPGTVEGRIVAYYKRDSETRQFAGVVATLGPVSGEATLGPYEFSTEIDVPDNGYSTLEFDLVPELFSVRFVGPTTVASCEVVGTAVTWRKGGTGFSDDGRDIDYLQSPPRQASLFESIGRYPGAVTFYQQRLLLSGSDIEPERTFGSQTGSYFNFTTSLPLADSDALNFKLAGRRVNRVRHLMDLGQLLMFSSAGEWTVEGDSEGTLKPSAINPRTRSANGTGRLAPLLVDRSVLYVQARNAIVRDLQNDLVEGIKGNDLSVTSRHLFRGYTLDDWAYQLNPTSTAWIVRSDGTLLGLTYMRDQEVVGWHRHDTRGAFENVCVIPEGNEDALYCIVKRRINGADVRFIERAVDRAILPSTDLRDLFFVDCGTTYDGRNRSATTMALSSGVSWASTELLTCTASVGTFTVDDVGNGVFFTDSAGETLRFVIQNFVSATVVTGQCDRTVPVELRSMATTTWARAVKHVTGLDYLEGESVSVFADGAVIASPNNAAYSPLFVSGGELEFSEPFAVIHVGLPYTSDLETLDLDTPQGASLKSRAMVITGVRLFLENSRGGFVGVNPGTNENPLHNLIEIPTSDSDAETPHLTTDDQGTLITSSWNNNARIFVRQVDPLPMSILSATPEGTI